MLWPECKTTHFPFVGNDFKVAIPETWNLTETHKILLLFLMAVGKQLLGALLPPTELESGKLA